LYFKIFLYIDKSTVFQFYFVSATKRGSSKNLQQRNVQCTAADQLLPSRIRANAKLAQVHENVWTNINKYIHENRLQRIWFHSNFRYIFQNWQ